MNPLESHLILLLDPAIKELGYDLVEVNYRMNKEANSLSVVVDRVEPISLSDIVKVSERVSALLDEDDSIEDAYNLDVSSLGAEKPVAIEKLPLYVGRYVNLHLENPLNGENYLEGTLIEANEDTYVLEVKEKGRKRKLTLEKGNVDKARLAIEF